MFCSGAVFFVLPHRLGERRESACWPARQAAKKRWPSRAALGASGWRLAPTDADRKRVCSRVSEAFSDYSWPCGALICWWLQALKISRDLMKSRSTNGCCVFTLLISVLSGILFGPCAGDSKQPQI